MLDKKSNFGNIEHAKLHDINEGYEALQRGEENVLERASTRINKSSVSICRVRMYMCIVGIVLVGTWISFGMADLAFPWGGALKH